jgi:hypothetical protein
MMIKNAKRAFYLVFEFLFFNKKNRIKSKEDVDILMEYQIHLDHRYVVQNLLLLMH